MLPPLNVLIEATTTAFDRAMDRASERMDGFRGRTQRAGQGLTNFGNRTQALGRQMSFLSGGIVAGAVGMFALARGTASAGDEIAKSARAAGVSGEAFQELTFALGQVAGMSQEQVATALQRLTRSMGEAVDGNEDFIRTFEAAGISLEEIQNGTVTTEEAFMRLVDAFRNAETDAEAARIGFDLLGRAGGGMAVQLRNAGADIDALRQRAHELGIVLDEDALASSEEFNDQLDELQRQMANVGRTIGVVLLPVMVDFMQTLQERVIPAVTELAGRVGEWITWFGELPGPVQEAAGVIAAALGVGGPVLVAIGLVSRALGALVAATGPVGLFIAAAALLWTAWQRWGDDIMALVASVAEWFEVKFNEIIEFLASLPERFYEFGAAIVQGLLDGINAVWENLRERILELGELLPEWLRERLGIASPSRVMHEIGMQVGQGLANGIADAQGMIAAAMQTATAPIEMTAGQVASSVIDSMSQMFDNSKPLAIAQALINTWLGITEALKLPFPQSLAAAASVAAQGFAAVRGIRSTNKSGTSGGGGGSGSSSGSDRTRAPERAERAPVSLTLIGERGFTRAQIVQMAEALNDSGDDGQRLIDIRGR